jgi:hypothetical protein
MAESNWFKTLAQGIADSGVNLLAQNAPQPKGNVSKKIGQACTPCAIRAKREAMQKRWRGNS